MVTYTPFVSTPVRVTFDTFSPLLNKFFRHTLDFTSMTAFRLHATALYSGNWSVVSILNLPRSTDAVTAAVASLTPALVAEYHAETDKMVWVLETFFPGLGIDRAESMILAVEDAIVAFPG